ncbi:MAG: prepilin-type N-terminal cleavage/methylation domain-containing protein [Sedimentisphaerales bacterium]|jgi:prepilin-type N-terminal cleavage/methylation domain-containing protein
MKRNGFTLIEVIIAIAASCMVMLTVAILVQSGYKSWNRTYKTSNADSRLDSIGTITAFGSFGRKSNKKDYYVYSVSGTTYTQVKPVANPEEILTGQAVEFRYWSTDLTAAMLNPTSVADKYVLFYLDSGQLKLDYGTSVGGPTGGAINTAGHRVTGTDVTTVTLAKNVTSVAFSHTTKDMAGDGNGCVRMILVINDPNDHKTNTFLAATYLRNIWPE